jgi:uncharacterized protein (DUF433 family)
MLLFSEAAMTNLLSVIHSDPDILSGTPVFVGTRVPVKNLLDYLAAGHPLSEFLDHFPSVQHDQAIAVLQHQSIEDLTNRDCSLRLRSGNNL